MMAADCWQFILWVLGWSRGMLKDVWNFTSSFVLVTQSFVKFIPVSRCCSQVLKRMLPVLVSVLSLSPGLPQPQGFEGTSF